MTQTILDTIVSAETPEGIAIELRPAGLCSRCYAYLLDQLIRLGVLYAVAIATSLMGGFGLGLSLILLFGLEWFYPVVFELSRSGATPGKRVFGIKVVMDSGLPVTPAASITRNLLRVADFLPMLYGFGILSTLLRRDFKRLGDITAGTLVVYEPPRAPKIAFDELEPLAPVQPLQPQQQAAVVALAARSSRLTPERLDELSALAGWASGDAGRSGREVTRRVLAVAQWLLGKR
ncbi:MAG TPA: RDD family protein [Woeseiaceae bacterium]|nr:RDD family protein [Woeseiaceae bacterium]